MTHPQHGDGWPDIQAQQQVQPVAAVAEYTSPMHLGIVRSEPGSWPICGMALEPRSISVEKEDNAELRDMRRRF